MKTLALESPDVVPLLGLIVGVLTLCVAAFGVFLTWYLPIRKQLKDQEPWVEFSVGSFSAGGSQGLNVRLLNKRGAPGGPPHRES